MTSFQPDLTKPQLFLDDQWIAASSRLQRCWFSPRKYPHPVLTAEHPWEYNCPVLFGSVLHRDGLFRMWYVAWTRHVPLRACYAESHDGVHWRKPRLGLHEFEGSMDNNIVFNPFSTHAIIDDLTIIEDDEHDPRWPLKVLFWESTKTPSVSNHNIYAGRSADGIHWEMLGPVLPNWGDRFNAVPRRINGKFVVFGRAPDRDPMGSGRAVWRTESSDLKRWSKPRLVLTSDHEDPALMEIYSLSAFPHHDLLLGGIERMHMSPDQVDCELTWSRDAGCTWQRSRPRPSFIPLGAPGAWDDTWINLPANAPLVRADSLWFYYSGRSGAHGVVYPHNAGGIGLATLRHDGFCALRAREHPGRLLTPVFTWPGGDLQVNVDCRRDEHSHPRNILPGVLRVEARDAAGKAIKGFTLADFTVRKLNQTNAQLRWNDKSLDRLRGRKVQLFFEMTDTLLYSFHAEKAGK